MIKLNRTASDGKLGEGMGTRLVTSGSQWLISGVSQWLPCSGSQWFLVVLNHY